ncbi:MAG: hypothetical protein JXN60_08465 [Lentisphaerae bacterium]|nr:hypothetical protein [Lentisphaerota bacterium]
MKFSKFCGTPRELGVNYATAFREHIEKNVDMLVKRFRNGAAVILSDSSFTKWVEDQREVISLNWPWLIEEMKGVAEGACQDFQDILFLNLRVWQYAYYSEKAASSCSSVIVELADGSIANAGALDDATCFYDGMVKIIPDHGYRYLTFPIIGTSWGNRGINNAGLCIGTSTQILKGVERSPGSICADIANRVILQTCATVGDVRNFCNKHPFTLNLACSDKNGDVFCAHQTTAGTYELPQGSPCVLANHVADDRIMYELSQKGVSEFQENITTRMRRGRLLDFILRFNKKSTAEDVRQYIADRMQGHPSSICPRGNLVLTYANSQREPGALWIAHPQAEDSEQWELYIL